MAYSVSCHFGSSYSLGHNRRDEEYIKNQEHIKKDGPHESIIDQNIDDFYKNTFGESVKEFNQKEKHTDRHIKSYLQKVRKDKKLNECYECIATVGNMEEHPDEKTCKAILTEFLESWKKDNPKMRIVGAYYHADEEGAPHMHIDFVPVAEYKKGLSLRNSLSKAIEQQDGYKTAKSLGTGQTQWQHKVRESLRSICKAHGLEVQDEKNEHLAHVDTDIYKSRQDVINAVTTARERAKVIYGAYPEELEEKAEEWAQKVEKLENDYNSFVTKSTEAINEQFKINQQIKEKKKELEGLEGRILTAKEVNETKYNRELIGGKIKLSPDDFKDLMATAGKVDKADELMEKAQRIQKDAQAVLDQRDSIISNAQNKADEMVVKAEAKVAKLQAVERSISERITEHLKELWDKFMDTIKPYTRKAPDQFTAGSLMTIEKNTHEDVERDYKIPEQLKKPMKEKVSDTIDKVEEDIQKIEPTYHSKRKVR